MASYSRGVPLRVTFHDQDAADGLVATLTTAGFDAGVTRERFAGDDDGEEVVFVVHTDAPAADVEDLVADSDAFVEKASPLTEAPPPDAPQLPTAPRRAPPVAEGS